MARKQQEKSLQTQRELMESAERLFAAKGFVATTIAEITAEAGYAKGNFYRHWPSKDEIMLQIIADKMEAYRRMLLSDRGGSSARAREEKPRETPKVKRPARTAVASLKADVAKCEARVAKLEEMRESIDLRLSNPLLYARGDSDEIETLRRKRAEVQDGLTRAEALWLAALERLEAAGEA